MKNTILVVEDDADICENLKELLETNSYNVLTALSGLEAVKIIKQTPPDLILSDITMPVMDGLDLLAHVQNDKNLSHIPFVFLTAKSSSEDIRRGMLNGADDYLSKPYRSDDLLKTIEIRIKKMGLVRDKLTAIRENIAFSVPHELRTPLVPILGYSDLLIDSLESLDPGEIREIAGKIKSNAFRLKNIIEKFILYSNLEFELNSLQEHIDRPYTSLAALRHLLNQLIKKEFPAQSSRIVITELCENFPADTDIRIDEKYLLISIKETIENSIKFSPPGSIILITSAVNNGFFEFTVGNTGSYISPDNINNIAVFSKQFNPSIIGSGLGLPIIKKITDFFGGSFIIESRQENRSTSIRISVPVSEHKKAAV